MRHTWVLIREHPTFPGGSAGASSLKRSRERTSKDVQIFSWRLADAHASRHRCLKMFVVSVLRNTEVFLNNTKSNITSEIPLLVFCSTSFSNQRNRVCLSQLFVSFWFHWASEGTSCSWLTQADFKMPSKNAQTALMVAKARLYRCTLRFHNLSLRSSLWGKGFRQEAWAPPRLRFSINLEVPP